MISAYTTTVEDPTLQEIEESVGARLEVAEFQYRQRVAVRWAKDIMGAVGIEEPDVTLREGSTLDHEIRRKDTKSKPIWIDREYQDPNLPLLNGLFAQIRRTTVTHHILKLRLLRRPIEVASYEEDEWPWPELYVVERHLGSPDDMENTRQLHPDGGRLHSFVAPKTQSSGPLKKGYEEGLQRFTEETVMLAGIENIELVSPRYIR